MSMQDPYASTVRQSQEAWASVIESLTTNVQAFTRSANPVGNVDPNAAIDQIFDFWAKTLEAQRDALKQLAGASISAGERIRSQVESQVEQVGSAAREQSEKTQQVAREEAESAKRAERDEAAARYAELNKGELQDELASRDLPRTGNVEELRERLIADDLK